MERLVDLAGFLHAQPLLFHQFIDIQTIALGGGHSSSGGVGLLQITQLRQIGQFIANGGGGHIQVKLLLKGFGTHRFCGLDIAFHHGLQNFLFALSQRHRSHLPS